MQRIVLDSYNLDARTSTLLLQAGLHVRIRLDAFTAKQRY